MPRKKRVHFPGALYHVIVRGNNGAHILSERLDKVKYQNTIARYKEKYDFLLYAYVIMDNHAHLLIEVKETPLSKIMQGIQQVYTVYYNKKYDRTGHAFGQRYKAFLCDKDDYFLSLVRYIHQNPVKADVVSRCNDYQWSSYREYVSQAKAVDVDHVLRLFSEDRNKAVRAFVSFMEEDEHHIQQDGDAYVDPWFIEKPQLKRLGNDYTCKTSMQGLIAKIGSAMNEPHFVTSRSRRRGVAQARRAFVIGASIFCDVTQTEIACLLQCSPAYVSKVLSAATEGEIAEVRMIVHQHEAE